MPTSRRGSVFSEAGSPEYYTAFDGFSDDSDDLGVNTPVRGLGVSYSPSKRAKLSVTRQNLPGIDEETRSAAARRALGDDSPPATPPPISPPVPDTAQLATKTNHPINHTINHGTPSLSKTTSPNKPSFVNGNPASLSEEEYVNFTTEFMALRQLSRPVKSPSRQTKPSLSSEMIVLSSGHRASTTSARPKSRPFFVTNKKQGPLFPSKDAPVTSRDDAEPMNVDNQENPFVDKGKGKAREQPRPQSHPQASSSGSNSPHKIGPSANVPTHAPFPPQRTETESPHARLQSQASTTGSASPHKAGHNVPEPARAPPPLQHADTDPVLCQRPPSEVPGDEVTRPANSAPELGCRALQPIQVVCNKSKVHRMDINDVPFAVRWWLADKILAEELTWDHLSEDVLSQIRGTNEEVMPNLSRVFGRESYKREFSANDTAVWKQLDLEAASREEDLNRGLGCFTGHDSYRSLSTDRTTTFPALWHSGKVEFRARLVPSTPKGNYTLKLFKPKLGRSCQFSRSVGSEDCLILKPSARDEFDVDEQLFIGTHSFVIMDKHFHVFCGKKDTAYLGSFSGGDYGASSTFSFVGAIKAFNDYTVNGDQLLTKYATRQELLFSTSKPVVRFCGLDDDIYMINDKLGDGIGARYVKTDGHGFANCAFFSRIQCVLGISEWISTVQGRVFGSKGLWSLHPECLNCAGSESCETPKIWIRKSQRKIWFNLATKVHDSHLVFNLVRIPRVSSATISTQIAMNLCANGVPNSVLVDMMRKGLNDELLPLLDWNPPQLVNLADHISKLKQIVTQRLRCGSGSQARLFGLAREEVEAPDAVVIDDVAGQIVYPHVDEFATLVHRNPISGYPSLRHEKVIHLLQAGFQPQENPVIREIIKLIAEDVFEEAKEDCRLIIDLAWQAMIIPDPLGILKPGEIYFRSSRSINKKFGWGDVLEGDIILWRYPTYHASDSQKYRAVNYPELSRWPDVIILSTLGQESTANIHSGGDFDGGEHSIKFFQQNSVPPADYASVSIDPALLRCFKGSPRVAEPNLDSEQDPAGTLACNHFSSSSGPPFSSTEITYCAVQAFSHGCSNTRVGLYSTFWANAAYNLGYTHSDVVRLGFIANIELDSKKQGRPIKEATFLQDRKNFQEKPLALQSKQIRMESLHRMSPAKRSHEKEILERRGTDLAGGNIVEVLRAGAEQQEKSFFEEFERQIQNCSSSVDTDCILEYHQLCTVARNFPVLGMETPNPMQAELDRLEEHVKSIHDRYKCLFQQLKKGTAAPHERDQLLTNLAFDFFRYPGDPLVFLTSGSAESFLVGAAYKISHPGLNTFKLWHYEFPFNMAFSKAAALKAASSNCNSDTHHNLLHAPCMSLKLPFADCSVMKTSLVEAFYNRGS